MTNDRLAKIEEAISLISQRGDAKSDIRDSEFGEIREAFATLAARQSNIESANTRIEAAVVALQSIKPPSIISIWGPVLATAGILGTLFGAFLDAKIDPLVTRINILRDYIQTIDERQFDKQGEVARLDERTKAIQNQLNDVDKEGSRKWVAK